MSLNERGDVMNTLKFDFFAFLDNLSRLDKGEVAIPMLYGAFPRFMSMVGRPLSDTEADYTALCKSYMLLDDHEDLATKVMGAFYHAFTPDVIMDEGDNKNALNVFFDNNVDKYDGLLRHELNHCCTLHYNVFGVVVSGLDGVPLGCIHIAMEDGDTHFKLHVYDMAIFTLVNDIDKFLQSDVFFDQVAIMTGNIEDSPIGSLS